jgi:hypothetical protein
VHRLLVEQEQDRGTDVTAWGPPAAPAVAATATGGRIAMVGSAVGHRAAAAMPPAARYLRGFDVSHVIS